MHRRCRTWLGRCIRGAPSSFKRLLKTPRQYRKAIYWSISNRTRPRTCVCARQSFQTTVFSTCTCRRYKKTPCVDSLLIRTMSDLVKRHILCIQALNRYKSNKLRRASRACHEKWSQNGCRNKTPIPYTNRLDVISRDDASSWVVYIRSGRPISSICRS